MADGIEIGDFDDIDQLVKLFFHLFENAIIARRDDRHTRDGGILSLAHRQAVDIKTARRKQGGNAGQNAKFIFREHAQRPRRVFFNRFHKNVDYSKNGLKRPGRSSKVKKRNEWC